MFFYELLWLDLPLPVSSEENPVVHILACFRYPHGELPGSQGGLSIQHSRMEGDVPELAEDQLQPGVAAAFRLLIQHVVRQGIQVCHCLLLNRVQVIQQLFVGQDDGGGVVGIVHPLLMKGRLFKDIGVDEPLVRGMECMVHPAPAGSSAAQGIPVICADGGADVQEIRSDRFFDDHA